MNEKLKKAIKLCDELNIRTFCGKNVFDFVIDNFSNNERELDSFIKFLEMRLNKEVK